MLMIKDIIAKRAQQSKETQEVFQKVDKTLTEEEMHWESCKAHVDSLPLDVVGTLTKFKPKEFEMSKSNRYSRYLQPYYYLYLGEQRKIDIEVIVYEWKDGTTKLAEYVAWNNELSRAYVREIIGTNEKPIPNPRGGDK